MIIGLVSFMLRLICTQGSPVTKRSVSFDSEAFRGAVQQERRARSVGSKLPAGPKDISGESESLGIEGQGTAKP